MASLNVLALESITIGYLETLGLISVTVESQVSPSPE